jgi:cyclase
MLQTRIIPALLLRENALVKTVKFKNASYIGDPINTVRIFNELEVDELVFLDIEATPRNREPNLRILREIANECFMPLAYGGGITDFDTASKIFNIGFEKVVLNSALYSYPELIGQIADHFGSQSVVASIDVKKNFWGNYEVWTNSGLTNTKKNPEQWCKELQELGVGEILLTSIDKEGSWSGFDIELIKKVSEVVNVPVIAHGGAGSIEHIQQAVELGKVSAVALGSMLVYQQKGMGVLINFPDHMQIKEAIK